MADNKRLRFDLELHANSKAAKDEIKQLGEMLNQLAMKNLKLSLTQNISEDLKQASKEVGEFSALLNKSFDANTGKLDLSKLSTSLKAANTDITQVAKSFAALGNDGTMAFASVVKQINAAEVPLKKTNALVDKMWTSLKNTAQWTISSSAIHGLQSAMSSAYGYAQDLNKSLNDIRIVTGYNIDQMSKFADEANKAAKALSTTTTVYTDASLLYFQQGLSDADVAARTEVTIKMANAAGQSAATVSDQLTAVWNNFYDGSKSLEYYADVMTALGAATASSTDEIAEGLEKFAAVADTVGLSYDYAATALATVTATTRQSADVVGTAFKTLFARMQDLELGKTLDDGTTLGQYSQALAAVGVNIKTASGEMKDMDDILDELGAKWKTLSKDVQVATAQAVGGTRQYNQLIALMDNWDYFQENLTVAQSSSGTLDAQAEIYAESWEAAQKRVKASLETLYTTLIDDKFFIKLTNTVAKLVDGITNMVNGLGGVKGLLATISTYVLTIGRTKISEELVRLTGPSQAKQAEIAKQQKMEANAAFQSMVAGGNSTKEGKDIAAIYGKIADINDAILEKQDQLSDTQRTIVNAYREQYEQLGNIVILKAKAVDQAEKEEQALIRAAEAQDRAAKRKQIHAIDSISGTGNLLNRRSKAFSQEEIDQLQGVMTTAGLGTLTEDQITSLQIDNSSLSGAAQASHLEKYQSILAEIAKKAEEVRRNLTTAQPPDISQDLEKYRELSRITKSFSEFGEGDSIEADSLLQQYQELRKANEEMAQHLDNAMFSLQDSEFSEFDFSSIEALIKRLKEVEAAGEDAGDELWELRDLVGKVAENANKNATTAIQENNNHIDPKVIADATAQIDDTIDKTQELTEAEKRSEEQKEATLEKVQEQKAEIPGWQEQLVSAAGVITGLISLFQTASGIIDTFNNPDLTVWEKFTTVFTTLLTVIPSFIAVYKSLQDMQLKETIARVANTLAAKAEEKQLKKTNAAKSKGAEATTEAAVTEGAEAAAKAAKTGGEAAVAGGTKVASTGANLLSIVKNFIALYGTVLLAVAAVAAIVAGCAIAYKALNDKLNENEIAAQKAEEAAKNLSEAYNDAKAEYDELINTISSYDSAKDSIAELTRGTAEFSQAIQDANDEALKLLDTYGGIIGDRYHVDSDGLIAIENEALEDIKKQELAKTRQAQSASIIANQQAREARMKADVTELNREKIKSSEGMTDEDWARTGEAAAASAATGAVIGGIIGSIIPGIGTAVGGAIGAGAGATIGGRTAARINYNKKNSETEEEEAAVNQLLNDYVTKGNAVFDDEYIKEVAKGNKSLADELIKNKASLEELAKEMKANTIATNAENAAMANSILADNEAVQSSRYADKVGVFAASAYADASQEAYDKYAANRNNNLFATGTSTSKELFKRYAEAQGLSDYDVTNYKRNGGVTYKYVDEETGETVKKTVSAEEIASVLAAQDAEAATNTAGEDIAKILGDLKESSVNLLSAAKSGDMSTATVGELSSGISSEIQNMSIDDLKALGFEGTKSEILQQIADQQNASLNDLRDYADAYGGVASEVVNQILDSNDATFKDISQSALKQYASILNDLTYAGGEETAQQFSEGLSGIMDQYANRSTEIMAAANNIDWTTGEDALQEFNYQLLKMGINIDENSEEWQKMVKAAKGVNVSILNRDLDTIRSKIASIKKLTESIEIGGVISDEDYDTLIKYNAALADMFIMTADGYKYIGGGDITKAGADYAKKQFEGLKKENELARKMGDSFGKMTTQTGKSVDWYSLSNGTASDADMSSIATRLASELTEEELSFLGVGGSAEVNSLISTLNDANATEEQKKNARTLLQGFYETVLGVKQNYDNKLYDDTTAKELYASTATSIADLNKMVEEGSIEAANWADGQQNAYEKQATLLTNSALSTATTYGQIQEAAREAIENGIVIDQEQYQTALQRIAKDYKNCDEELAKYQKALKTNNPTLIKHAENLLAAAMAAEDLANAYGLDATHISRYAEELKNSGKYSKASAETLNEMAKDQLLFDKAIESSAEHMTEWEDAVKNAAVTGHLASEASTELATTYGDLLDIDGTQLSSNFLKSQQALNLLQDVFSEKSEEERQQAYKDLQNLALTDLAFQNGLQNNLAAFDAYVQAIKLDTIEVGADIDTTLFDEMLLKILNDAHVTADTATKILSTIGLDASFGVDSNGNLTTTSLSKSIDYSTKYASSSYIAKQAQVEKTQLDDLLDRYKEIEDELAEISKKMDQATKAADRLYGKSRISAMQEVTKQLEEQTKALEEQKRQAETYRSQDLSALGAAASALGVSLTIDGNGNITNYTDTIESLYSTLAAKENSGSTDAKSYKEKIETLIEAATQYDNTADKIEDIEERIQDTLYEFQDQNMEIFNYTIETDFELNEDQLELLDWQLDLIKDDVYSAAEGFSLLNDKMSIYQSNLGKWGLEGSGGYVDQLQAKYANREISQADYIEGLNSAQDSILSNLQSLKELDEEMMSYYGDTLASAQEEIDKYTEGMENVTSVLDHYSSFLSLLGKDKNYKLMGSILESQANNIHNQYEVAKESYAMYAAETEKWKQKMDEAIGDEEAYELYQKNWEAANEKMQEAQDEMLTKTEEWAEKQKEIIKNALDEMAADLEKSLTGGTTFDELTTQMDRANTLQEEYLTTTNQIYETNKLMRQAESEIEKTSNTVAKKRLKDFVNQTQQMQEQGKLSQYELEIQQAKYDLLLAEIALEEAQSAKSTVRLRRGADGSYGYVYTADESTVSDAQQAVADAQNKIYNKGLEGANNYSEKYISTMQEMYNELKQIQEDYLNGEITSEEEYNEKMRAAKEYYFQKLNQYSELYRLSTTADSAVVRDSWSSDFSDMIYDTENLEVQVNAYVDNTAEKLSTWSQIVSQAMESAGLDTAYDQLTDLDQASDDLLDTLTGPDGLISKLSDQATQVGNLTSAYALQREQVKGLITDYTNLATAIAQYQATAASTDTYTPPTSNNGGSTTVGGSGGEGTGSDLDYTPSSVNEYTATVYFNGGTLISGSTSFKGSAGTSVTLPTLGRGGYVLSGWTVTSGTVSGQTFTFGESNATISARWKAVSSNKYGGGGSSGHVGIDDGATRSQFAYTAMYDTGGYTGSWGSSGKLAVLHEKELVLNKDQTQDLLQTVGIMDKIIQMIDLQTLNTSLGGLLVSPTYKGVNNDVLEQNVHIEASFPNATNHSEIEEAFKNLTNLASQYANRK